MLQTIARKILAFFRWTLVGEIPPIKKGVFVAAYHTSNWDGFWFIVYKFAINVRVRFLAKHTLFWWPMGPFLRKLGAIPIDRDHTHSTVQMLVDTFRNEDHLFLALAPEGTRKWQPYWKSGFYQIAKKAGVPIVLAFIDYRKKEIGIGISIEPGDRQKDLQTMRDFYRNVTPRHPANQGPVAFPPD
ncbi:MAG: 1-acyl-sn-glycerol-3-phosphate acyltransferase [Gammaproteobacteria bacterium]|nr:1-acyl-sn-glycerol-3-phosphate acyltransferase [Gammaproteobacteria bacterium]MDH4314274.1 1-acyl-sn-glycerol-3-phosphate acyltransferase [Gammaproteobacteria bacterium]MDH5213659.1 1-acyl-sn-glycerol-3-phosphate acyltransferase [Gammaproteobacteria bacterium]MDH5500577.1 1-acyl-sn-glycerol-3-phosphate acyltransferase [Gammaproteobacteria bacterium]